MRTQENVTIYHCDFCNKQLKRKHAMLNHEENCLNNPKNAVACYADGGCVHLRYIDVEIDSNTRFDQYGEPYYDTIKSHCNKCVKKNIEMFTPNAERRGLQNKYPDDFEDQEPMPRVSCEHFEKFELPF